MRVVLIATNRHGRLMSRMDARPLPIGLAYVAGHLDPLLHTTKVLDLMFSEDYQADVAAIVKNFKPDLVGLSLRNLDNGSYLDPQWALPITKEVTENIRSISNATIVCGGPAFSILPRECFAYIEPDVGVVGDGGETFAVLADRLEASQSYRGLPGLIYRGERSNRFQRHIVVFQFCQAAALGRLGPGPLQPGRLWHWDTHQAWRLLLPYSGF